MPTQFVKMNGAGNDFVIVDALSNEVPQNPAEFARRLCDRRRGVGADGLIVLHPSSSRDVDVDMQIWNADGSDGLMCGNGARCVALWMKRQQRVVDRCRIQTATRVVEAIIGNADPPADGRGDSVAVTVDMGTPSFDASAINVPIFLMAKDVPGLEPRELDSTLVSMGNPHAVIFGQELSDRNVLRLGRVLQNHPDFSDGVNVEWVDVVSPTQMNVRVFERGVGETLACGSGACAAVVAATLRFHCQRQTDVDVDLPGGRLTVRWESTDRVLLTGPAEICFSGEIPG